MKSVWERVESLIGVKTARYSLVSAISVVVTQIVLVTCAGVIGWSGTVSNVIAVSVGAAPSYSLNRRWTWGKTGRNHLWREVVPFWGMSLLGLAVSTGFVAFAEDRWDATWALSLANLAAFGVLWVAKFAVLHLVLFKVEEPEEAQAPLTVC